MQAGIVRAACAELQPLPEVVALRGQGHRRRDRPPRSSEGQIIRAGYHAELDELRAISRNAKDDRRSHGEREREGRTGIPSLKIRYNRVFGYYIEVTKPNLRAVPGDYMRKQTLANAERFVTARAQGARGEDPATPRSSIGGIEKRLYLDVLRRRCQRVAPQLTATPTASPCWTSLAASPSSRQRRGYVRPEVDDGTAIAHPGRPPPGGRGGVRPRRSSPTT